MVRAGRGQDELEGMVGDEMRVGKAGRKSAHDGWISKGLAKRKDRVKT